MRKGIQTILAPFKTAQLSADTKCSKIATGKRILNFSQQKMIIKISDIRKQIKIKGLQTCNFLQRNILCFFKRFKA